MVPFEAGILSRAAAGSRRLNKRSSKDYCYHCPLLVVVVVLTLTRILSSPWSQDRLQSLWSGTVSQGKEQTKPKVVHIYQSSSISCIRLKI